MKSVIALYIIQQSVKFDGSNLMLLGISLVSIGRDVQGGYDVEINSLQHGFTEN